MALEVTLAPDDETSFTGNMVIVSNDPNEDTLTVSLSGTGTQQAPIMELSDDSLYFGVVVAGQTVTRQTTIYNMGMLDLEVEELNMAGSELFTTDFSDATVEPGDSVELEFLFSPTEQITEATATSTVVGSGVADQTITLYAGEVLTAENDFIPSEYILYQNHPTSKPVSSAMAGNPVIRWTVRAFKREFSSSVAPVSSISPTSGKLSRLKTISPCLPKAAFISFFLSGLCVARTSFFRRDIPFSPCKKCRGTYKNLSVDTSDC